LNTSEIPLVLILVFGGLLVSFLGARAIRMVLIGSIPSLEKSSSRLKRFISLAQIILFLMILGFFIPLLEVQPFMDTLFRQVVRVSLVLVTGFLAVWGILLFEEVLLKHYSLDKKDNLKARKVHTQFQLFKKIVFLIIGLVTFMVLIMSFESFRKIGTALIASAGVASLIIGLAAQKTLAAILSGLQLAITQPVRIDDVVVVEGEWGRIEEIALTYVVVRTWDLRRLILPTTYFLEKPFQNWTRVSSELLGTIFLYTDYRVSVDRIREEVYQVLSEDPRWNGKAWGVQVTDNRDGQLEMRILLSASDAADAWDLRCSLREKMLSFISDQYPEVLPVTRIILESGNSGQG